MNIFVKIEAFNPLGSVKDRLALGVIEAAEKSGELKPGQTVIEATSGNTGIGLAMVCAAKGYPLVVTIAEPFSVERRKLMRFLGAKVIVTPAAERGMGMIKKTIELAEAHGWFMTRQFENEANPDFHSRTTAPEILDDFAGERLDYWVTGYGTGGTLKGVARVLAKERPETKIVVCEPEDAQLLGSGIAQSRNSDGTPAAAHPTFKPHPIQVRRRISSQSDRRCGRNEGHRSPSADRRPEAIRRRKDLATHEASLSASPQVDLAGALEIPAEAKKKTNILCMLPDAGERYLTRPFSPMCRQTSMRRSLRFRDRRQAHSSILRQFPACALSTNVPRGSAQGRPPRLRCRPASVPN